ncbi:unnamed protein product [Ceutorhynchus assimilis]|uniref:Centromere/kinetochore protein zw10 n=1 Tax=Ceutorhynchus assimilis TaxID=467358 RepID=A0A9N9QGB9_9CUCU|nr:unnamed protein product [Ceutorhynchus assimilis]
MSILAEILPAVTKIDVDEVNKKVPKLKQDVESLKNDIIINVENIYVKYNHRHTTNNILLEKAKQFQNTLTDLKDKADFLANKDLTKADKDLKSNVNELYKVEFKMRVLLNLLNIMEQINNFKKNVAASQYVKCIAILKEFNAFIEAMPEDEKFDAINQLVLSVTEEELMLKNTLKNIITDNIYVKQVPEKHVTILKIKKPNEEMKTAIMAYYSSQNQVLLLSKIAKYLWEDLFVPIVNQEIEITEKDTISFASLNLNVKSADKKSDYTVVFNNLEKVLGFLTKHFNYDVTDNLTVLGYIGNDIRDNLSELIIKNCLRDTIPSSTEELQNYKVVIEATKKLEKSLLDAQIFTTDTTSILEYANNVDVLFINKMCKGYLESAIEIMKHDLHDIMDVGVPYNPEYPLGNVELEFSQCAISKNVQELLKFCEEILQKALGASPECSGRLFTTVTNILSKYLTFVPEFHKTYLTTLPQQIAVFLNNCQYISYTLVKWNMEYCSQLRHVLDTCDFSKEIGQFSSVEHELFQIYIDGQVKQIEEIMEGAQLEGRTIQKLDSKTEKSIRQCLRQQELLRTVWHKVLPYEVYNKNIGIIVNALCRCLIRDIIKFEDIPAKVAEDLVEVIKLILTRAPKLFINPNEVALYVPLWYKLNELSFVLNSSLMQINDRWADGKGPLALQFEGDELKGLIKALFQNTDRRAAVLAKIVTFNVRN